MPQQRPQSLLRRIDRDGKHFLVKTATPTGRQELIDQAGFYMTIPDTLKPIYPQVVQLSVTENGCEMVTPFYSMPTLTDILLYSSRSTTEIGEIILDVLRWLSARQYRLVMQRTGDSYLLDTYYDRIRDRMQRMRRLDQTLQRLVAADTIVVNGGRYLGLGPALSALEGQIRAGAFPAPRWKLLTHGQLRFDHILAEPDGVDPRFILLEPRGFAEPRDFGYELGKIWQCLRSRIVWIEQREFHMAAPVFRGGEATVSNFSLTQQTKCSTADGVLEVISAGIPDVVDHEFLYSGYMRVTRLAEAIHTCGGAPYFYRPDDPAIAYAYFILGTMQLNTVIHSDTQPPGFLLLHGGIE